LDHEDHLVCAARRAHRASWDRRVMLETQGHQDQRA